MKIQIKKEEYKKVTLDNFEVNIPENPCYYWHNGIRIAYSVVPVWTSWNKEHYSKDEEIYEFKIIEVDPTFKSIKVSNIRVSDLSETLTGRRNKEYSRLVENILLYPKENTREKEQFFKDYNKVLEDLGLYLS